ncbi:MAG: 2-C-methyl-D-erythritol 4-phosphate cytidylyltransferase [Ignavibacteria bacterium]
MKSEVKVIIPASGSGSRFGGKTAKQFLKVDGKEILTHTIKKFHDLKIIDEIIISTIPEFFVAVSTIVRKNNFTKVKKIVEGGKRRQDSVYNALINLDCKKDDIILVHDAVRPLVSEKLIKNVIADTEKNDCVIPVIKISDTLMRTDKNSFAKEIIDREGVVSVQTPQGFRFEILNKSFLKAYEEGFTGTDEASIVQKFGYKVKVTEGEKSNIKITVKGDLDEMKIFFKKRMSK